MKSRSRFLHLSSFSDSNSVMTAGQGLQRIDHCSCGTRVADCIYTSCSAGSNTRP